MLGVTFGSYHSYRAWGLLLKEYPYISPPEPKTKLIEVPGTDTVIDLTESLTSGVKYGLREAEFQFYLFGDRKKWKETYSSILNSLHGKRLKIVIDDDPNWYYIGRVSVGELDADKAVAGLTITAQVEPYKYARHGEGKKL